MNQYSYYYKYYFWSFIKTCSVAHEISRHPQVYQDRLFFMEVGFQGFKHVCKADHKAYQSVMKNGRILNRFVCHSTHFLCVLHLRCITTNTCDYSIAAEHRSSRVKSCSVTVHFLPDLHKQTSHRWKAASQIHSGASNIRALGRWTGSSCSRSFLCLRWKQTCAADVVTKEKTLQMSPFLTLTADCIWNSWLTLSLPALQLKHRHCWFSSSLNGMGVIITKGKGRLCCFHPCPTVSKTSQERLDIF